MISIVSGKNSYLMKKSMCRANICVSYNRNMSQITVTSSGMERSIHEMLKDAPSLNESDSAVHTGTPPPHVPNNCSSDSHPRPATINLSLGSPTTQTCKCQIMLLRVVY